jgi:uncharacterized protein
MRQPVVHFEIIGRNPARLREFYGALFGWEFDVGDATTDAVSDPGQYGFVHGASPGEGNALNGGVGGGESHEPRVLFYMAVPDVEAALKEAERLGGTRVLGPEGDADGGLVVGQLSDPEGNVVGVAGPV